MIDELFQPATNRFEDPRLQLWDNWLARPETQAVLEVEWPPYLAGQTRPEVTISAAGFGTDQGTLPFSIPMDWDDELNAVLLARRIRATDQTQEATRFSLALRASFRRAEREFGDGFFNSVFFAVLQEIGFAAHPDLTSLVDGLDYRQNLDSDPPTERFRNCHGMIKSAIQAKSHDLINTLGYSLPEAKEILVAALIDYIDRRFSVIIRRLHGLL